MDSEPIKLVPTWRNLQAGDVAIGKRLDRFLVSENMLSGLLLFNSWVAMGGLSDHLPILLQIGVSSAKPPSPFNSNSIWL